MSTPMDMARFQALLDAYGASPARWPDAERAAAEAFMAVHPPARAARRQALPFDAMLDTLTPPPLPADLAARIMAAVPDRQPVPVPVAANSNVRPWPMALALAASAAIGLWVGIAAGPLTGNATAGDLASLDQQEVVALAFGPLAENGVYGDE